MCGKCPNAKNKKTMNFENGDTHRRLITLNIKLLGNFTHLEVLAPLNLLDYDKPWYQGLA